jgi:CRISPR/Cas system type I-B associated protein Csh2 (Cas7 group RAMP superfamily)
VRKLIGNEESTFGLTMRRRLIEDFAVAYYNGSIKPNFAEKNPITLQDAEFLMDGPQFEKIPKSDIWTSSSAVGTGYQYRVIFRDKRFTDLDRLLEKYSAGVNTAESDQASVEERLHRLILQMIKEGRLPQSFKVQPTKDPRIEGLVSAVEHLTQALEDMEMRLKRLEEAQTAVSEPVLPSEPQVVN